MQRNCFLGPGTQNAGAFFAYQPTLQNNGHYPEIVGEGEVTSVVLPNGSVQYFFIPTYKRDLWTPFAYNPSAMNWNFTPQAWFVRNIANPIPAPFCIGQNLTSPCEGPLITSCLPMDFHSNPPAIGYNTFHYDKWTSTTDLRYFFPSSCHPIQPQNRTASVQINTPAVNTICHYEVVCSKPCECVGKCTSNVNTDKKVKQMATEKETKNVGCCMSVEEVKVTHESASYTQTSDNSTSMGGSRGRKNKKKLSFRGMSENSDSGNKRCKRKKQGLIKVIGKCDGECYCSSLNDSDATTDAEL